MMLEDKVAIVTGASMGIGRVIALRLAREGADVVVIANRGPIDEVAREIEALGRKSLSMVADVRKSDEVGEVVRAALQQFGKIDILVNNAGLTAGKNISLFCNSKEETWDLVLGVNLKGTLNCTRAVINHMLERHYGKIINIASHAGITGVKYFAEYSASKGGVIAFTMAVAKEVGALGVNVNCVSPGPIQTYAVQEDSPMIEELKKGTGMGRLGNPEDVASMVTFLASDEASFIAGQNFLVGGTINLGRI